ncbi:Protein phosphatase ImpM [Rubrivivax sp. A210]|nr:Protein phosphatase ImpM [Rubrivivax sp. A210]
MNAGPQAPGWHGKLPSLGDFASRRLDASFIEPWDGWLAAGLLALREAAPDTWLQDYLASPSWRFMLAAGVLPGAAGDAGWAGVLMPSVDRVGRYFPLTLVLPLGAGPGTTGEMAALWHWLGRLDDLARDALYEDWAADRLEDELARMALPELTPPPAALAWPTAGGGVAELTGPSGCDVVQLMGGAAQRAWLAHSHGCGCWHARPDEAPARILLTRGLPDAHSMARLFGPAATI